MAKSIGAEKIFMDKASGKNTNRNNLKDMLAYAREGDVIYVESISRIARNTKDLLNIIEELQKKNFTVGMMNPPYSQGSEDTPQLYEINFVKHLLDSLNDNSRCAVIVKQSVMVGKTALKSQ